MTIPWTKCSEQMPPEDQKTIFRRVDKDKFLFTMNVIDPQSLFFYMRKINLLEWTPYTPGAWAELNALDKKWLDDLPEFLKKQAD